METTKNKKEIKKVKEEKEEKVIVPAPATEKKTWDRIGPMSKEQKAKALALSAQGATLEAIASEVGRRVDTVRKLLKASPVPVPGTYSFPVRMGVSAEFKLPPDLTKSEAMRIARVIESLYVVEA